MTRSVKDIEADIAKLKREHNDAIKKAQTTCKHKHLREVDYKKLYESCLPPFRICLDCGMTEDGWGCGYIVLRGGDEAIPSIGRDEAYRLRRGLMIWDDHKGPLLRKETTVAELVKKVFKEQS
jgi:hypothetical protein